VAVVWAGGWHRPSGSVAREEKGKELWAGWGNGPERSGLHGKRGESRVGRQGIFPIVKLVPLGPWAILLVIFLFFSFGIVVIYILTNKHTQ
jgi:hypothetical protein